MGIGITRIGVYIPYYAIKREVIAKQWEDRPQKGERSLCNADEDSVTMAVEAAVNSIYGMDRGCLDGLFFASVTAPYGEKSHAVLMSKACDLPDLADVADFTGSTRGATEAVKAAYNAVKAGSNRNIIVTSADCRNAYPKSAQEQLFGDAAAAVVIGSEDVAAEIIASVSMNNEICDVWRNSKDDYVRLGEDRFIKSKGYTFSMTAVIKTLLNKTSTEIAAIDKFVLSATDFKEHLGVAKALGIPAEKIQDPLMLQIGDCGTAQPILLLAAVLARAKAGETILWASYGNGADALLLRVTSKIDDLPGKDQLGQYLATRRYLEAYPRFLSFRGLLEAVPGEPYKISPSTTMYWRDRNCILSFHGSRCKKCGLTMFPVNRICYDCHSKDEYEEVRLYERPFKLFTYSIDQLAGRSDDPMIGQAVAEDTEGTRVYMLITDFVKEDIRIGMDLEPTFRKMHDLGGFNNYYWKFRPVRNRRDV
jgi:3-hydroxy-3-methylglutaryl CoA synthase